MWRLFVSFSIHRVLLLGIALLLLNSQLPSLRHKKSLPEIHSTGSLISSFLDRIERAPEAAALQLSTEQSIAQSFHVLREPYLILVNFWVSVTRMPIGLSLLLWSNIFFVLVMWELYTLVIRFSNSETATATCLLLVLWPTSFEMSLGSGLAAATFMAVGSVRNAFENRWLFSGLLLAGLLLSDPMALGLIPVLIYFMYYFQRHFPIREATRSAVLFIAPVAAAAWMQWHVISEWTLSGSALASLRNIFSGHGIGWMFGKEMAGQTLALLFFAAGVVGAVACNLTWLQKILPIAFFLSVLIFTPWSSLASRLPFAAIALQGVAAASSRQALRAIYGMLLLLSVYEAYVLFTVP